eukprot:4111726-Alexandrium_andersonii.AAC.1
MQWATGPPWSSSSKPSTTASRAGTRGQRRLAQAAHSANRASRRGLGPPKHSAAFPLARAHELPE